MSWSEIDLPKLAGVAGATVGLIIATAILQSWLTAKYVPAFDRYRSLCEGLRGYEEATRRRGSMRDQIAVYARRLCWLNLASELLGWAQLSSLVTIAAATLSVLAPGAAVAALAGVVSLFAAFVLVGCAVGFVMAETRLDRKVIRSEVVDLEEMGRGPTDS